MKKLIIIFLLGLTAAKGFAQENLPPIYEITSDTADNILAGNYVQVLADKEQNITIASATTPALGSRFKLLPALTPEEKEKYHTYWIRFRVKNTSAMLCNISLATSADKAHFYVVDSTQKITHYKTGPDYNYKERNGLKHAFTVPINTIYPGETVTVYYERYSRAAGLPQGLEITLLSTAKVMAAELDSYEHNYFSGYYFFNASLFGLLILAAIFNFFFFLVVREKVYLYFSVFILVYNFSDDFFIRDVFFSGNYAASRLFDESLPLGVFFLIEFVRYYYKTFQLAPRWDKVLKALLILLVIQFIWSLLLSGYWPLPQLLEIAPLFLGITLLFVTMLVMFKRSGAAGRFFLLAIAPLISCLFFMLFIVVTAFLLNDDNNAFLNNVQAWIENWGDNIVSFSICWAVIVFSWALFHRYNMQRKEIAKQMLEKETMAKEQEIERSRLIAEQKVQLEKDVAERTEELKQSLEELKATQAQLIQSEKMASLGELTAGIAHEIQNPLNFVNNFSEVSTELVDEIKTALTAGDTGEALAIAADIQQNLEKINHHGKRADAIVKGMLQHSRKSTGQKELTGINELANEYLGLSYHGIRAKDKAFTAQLNTQFDETIGKLNIIPQEIGRVLLNLFNNAFYAVGEKKKAAPALPGGEEYEPTVTVTTKNLTAAAGNGSVTITVADNGNGIPQAIINKIFQPFFTTKPTGQGTGLGLSLSYDIVKAHGGDIKVETKPGEGTAFIIQLPARQA